MFAPHFGCGLTQIVEFPTAFATEESLLGDLLNNSTWPEQNISVKFKERSAIVRMWRDACSMAKGETTDGPKFDPAKYAKSELLAKFNTRYNFPLSLENQPSEATLTMIAKLHARRSCDFVPLSKITNAADNRDIALEPTRIKGAPFSISQNLSAPRKNTTSLSSPDAFIRAVKLLMNTYALVSVVDPDVGRCWRNLAAAQLHIGAIENFLRANALAGHSFLQRIADSELNVRTERMRLSQSHPEMSLSDVITTVAQNRSLWPLVSEFKPIRDTRRNNVPGGPKGNDKQRDQKGGGKKSQSDQNDPNHTREELPCVPPPFLSRLLPLPLSN